MVGRGDTMQYITQFALTARDAQLPRALAMRTNFYLHSRLLKNSRSAREDAPIERHRMTLVAATSV
jgi:hypothetical protein